MTGNASNRDGMKLRIATLTRLHLQVRSREYVENKKYEKFLMHGKNMKFRI
jgi:hypothetical protein